jgi:3-oxoacyl-[acyl-carrier protein] reductase
LVNNAGIVQASTVEKMTEKEWDEVMRVNLKGVFNCCKAVIKSMKRQKNGKIINISSLAGKNGGIKAGAAYSASKAGVICFTKTLARELSTYGINVNSVAPSMVETELAISFTNQEQRNELLAGIPLKRFAKAEEIADLVFFLSSNSSNYITGETININGGSYMD